MNSENTGFGQKNGRGGADVLSEFVTTEPNVNSMTEYIINAISFDGHEAYDETQEMLCILKDVYIASQDGTRFASSILNAYHFKNMTEATICIFRLHTDFNDSSIIPVEGEKQ